ncbi:hypothetical protein [Paenibacillus sp. KN14-4R]|uniref:hypothetical protein n=1 Tax=Paenibacillus sp. KN14-4R TaxID=3445773 RepID=UPI003FA0146F
MDNDFESDLKQKKKKIVRRSLLVFTSSILLVIGIIFTYSFKFGSEIVSGLCGNTIINKVEQPRNGLYEAVYFKRDCGATTGDSFHLSLIKHGSELENDRGNIFISNSEFQLIWQEPKNIVVIGGSGENFKKTSKFKGIEITYK